MDLDLLSALREENTNILAIKTPYNSYTYIGVDNTPQSMRSYIHNENSLNMLYRNVMRCEKSIKIGIILVLVNNKN